MSSMTGRSNPPPLLSSSSLPFEFFFYFEFLPAYGLFFISFSIWRGIWYIWGSLGLLVSADCPFMRDPSWRLLRAFVVLWILNMLRNYYKKYLILEPADRILRFLPIFYLKFGFNNSFVRKKKHYKKWRRTRIELAFPRMVAWCLSVRRRLLLILDHSFKIHNWPIGLA